MSEENSKKNEEELRELVLARLEIMPSNLKLSIGNYGTLTKQELIEHVRKGDDKGMQIVKMQMNFIRALSSGKLIEALNKNE